MSVLSNKTALFIGDSITAGVCDTDTIYSCKGWAGRVGEYCNMKSVQNNGQSGACIVKKQDLIYQYNEPRYYIYNQLDEAKDNQYDYVIIHGLYNDAACDTGLDNFEKELRTLLNTAKEQHPEAKVGFIVNYASKEEWIQERLATYANKAINICKEMEVPYLDLYTGSSMGVLKDGTIIDLPDDIHPSAKGYDSLYLKVADWMASIQ